MLSHSLLYVVPMLPVSQMSLSDYLIVSQLSRLSQLCPVSLDYCVSTENCLICLHGGVCVDFFRMMICKGGLKRKETEL